MDSRTLERELPEDAALRRREDVPSPDEDLLAYLHAADVNGTSDTGRVCATLIADYDEVDPADVRAAFLDAVGEADVDDEADVGGEVDVDGEDARTRIVESTRALLDADYEGRQAFVGVELPSGHVFADCISLPEEQSHYGSERYRAFVDRFGEPEGHATLVGQRVAIDYDETAERWLLDLEASDDASDEPASRTLLQYALTAGLYALAALVLVGGVAVGGALDPAGGGLLPVTTFVANALAVATAALLVTLVLSVGRTLDLGERVESAAEGR